MERASGHPPVFCALSGGLVCSEDDGETWHAITKPGLSDVLFSANGSAYSVVSSAGTVPTKLLNLETGEQSPIESLWANAFHSEEVPRIDQHGGFFGAGASSRGSLIAVTASADMQSAGVSNATGLYLFDLSETPTKWARIASGTVPLGCLTGYHGWVFASADGIFFAADQVPAIDTKAVRLDTVANVTACSDNTRGVLLGTASGGVINFEKYWDKLEFVRHLPARGLKGSVTGLWRDAASPYVVVAATSTGLFESTNGGNDFTEAVSPPGVRPGFLGILRGEGGFWLPATTGLYFAVDRIPRPWWNKAWPYTIHIAIGLSALLLAGLVLLIRWRRRRASQVPQ